jgi:hypothetical protein
LEEHVASIINVKARNEATCITLVSCLAYSSILMMVVTCSSEISVTFNGLHGIVSLKKELFTAAEVLKALCESPMSMVLHNIMHISHAVPHNP